MMSSLLPFFLGKVDKTALAEVRRIKPHNRFREGLGLKAGESFMEQEPFELVFKGHVRFTQGGTGEQNPRKEKQHKKTHRRKKRCRSLLQLIK